MIAVLIIINITIITIIIIVIILHMGGGCGWPMCVGQARSEDVQSRQLGPIWYIYIYMCIISLSLSIYIYIYYNNHNNNNSKIATAWAKKVTRIPHMGGSPSQTVTRSGKDSGDQGFDSSRSLLLMGDLYLCKGKLPPLLTRGFLLLAPVQTLPSGEPLPCNPAA